MKKPTVFIRLAAGLLALLLLIFAGACHRKTPLSEEDILAYYAELSLLMEEPGTLSSYFLVLGDSVTLCYGGKRYSSHTTAGGTFAVDPAHTEFAAWLRQSMPEDPKSVAALEGHISGEGVDYVCTLDFEEPHEGMSQFQFAKGDKGHTVFWLTREGEETFCVICVDIPTGQMKALLSRYAPRGLTLGEVGGREAADLDDILKD